MILQQLLRDATELIKKLMIWIRVAITYQVLCAGHQTIRVCHLALLHVLLHCLPLMLPKCPQALQPPLAVRLLWMSLFLLPVYAEVWWTNSPCPCTLSGSPKITRVQFDINATPHRTQKCQSNSHHDFYCFILLCFAWRWAHQEDKKEPKTSQHNHGKPIVSKARSQEHANKKIYTLFSFLAFF